MKAQPARRMIELSHPITSGEAGYPGLPVPRVEPHISHAASRSHYDGQAEFEISRLFLVGSTGTYLDSPYHRYPDGVDAGSLPLDRLADLPGVCLDGSTARGTRRLAVTLPSELAGCAVLLRTGWDRRRGTARYWQPGPFVDANLASALVEARVALVGVDFWNIDDTGDLRRPAHTALLAAGIPVVEHLRGLEALPDEGFRFFAVPAPIRGAASLPVRAFAILPTDADA